MKIHPLAIVAAVLFDGVFGFLWYAPFGFGTIWHELQPHAPAVEDLPGHVYGLSSLANIAKVVLLAFILDRAGVRTWHEGIKMALLMWLGLVVTIHFGSALFAGKHLGVLAINMGFHFVCFSVFGALLGGWRREKAEA